MSRLKHGMLQLAALSTMMGGMGLPDTRKPIEKEFDAEFTSMIKLCDEYNLIQQKKSKLSRTKRDMVESQVLYYSAKGKLFIENGVANIAIAIKIK